MSVLALTALAALVFAVAASLWYLGVLDKVLMHVLVVLAFAAGVLKSAFPVRFVIAIAAALLIAYLLSRAPRKASVMRGILVVFAVIAVTAFFLLAPLGPEISDPYYRYFVMWPILLGAGAVIAADDARILAFARIYVGWSVAFSGMAAVEALSGGTLFERSDLSRELVRADLQRAILLSEHPLVLSVLFVMALPLAWKYVSRLSLRFGVIVALIIGIWATGSRGAFVLAGLWALVEWMRRRLSLRMVRPLAILAVIGGGILIGSGLLNTGELSDTNADGASAEYRLSLYSVLGESLAASPLGWGTEGLPPGLFVVNSYFGPKDLADTVDSEIALAVFQYGVIGVVVLVVVGVFLLGSRALSFAHGQAAALCYLAGLYVALHVWTGLMLAFMLFLGAAWRASSLEGRTIQNKRNSDERPRGATYTSA